MRLEAFSKKEKKEYLKRIGVKYSKEEKKEIKKMINSDLTLEQFKLCVTPVVDKSVLKKHLEAPLDDKNFNESRWEKLLIRKLDVNQMKEIKRGFDKGLSEKEVELYVKSEYDSKTMEKIRSFLEKDKYKDYLQDYLMLSEINDIKTINSEKLEKYIKESKMNELRDKANTMEKWYNAEIYAGKEELEYHSPYKIRDDKKYVMKKIKEDGKNLEFASERLKSNRELVLEAVKQDGQALQFASEELKNDKEIVLESVKNNPISYQYASSNLQKNEEVVIEVIKRNEDALNYGDENLKKEIEEIREKYKDTDLDGLTDREEKFIYHTSPYSKDTDSDGRTDYEEIKIDHTNAKDSKKNKKLKKEQELER